MGNNKRKILFCFLSVLVLLSFARKVLAVCPICALAVGAGLGFSRWLGIDDNITGLWIGGLIVSLIVWTETWLDKKNITFKGRVFANILAWYFLLLGPLYYFDIGGLNKLLLGIIVGSSGFWFGSSWYFYLKKKNNNRGHFPFQKVVMPVLPLFVLSLIFYWLTK